MQSMEDIKFIMRTVGNVDLSGYADKIPNLIICKDMIHNAMDTFRMSMAMVGDSACVNMEDDIVLCNNFYDRILEEIVKRPDDVIQFFSMRKDDLTVGSRYITGSKYLMNQCFYLPKGMSADVLKYMDSWGRYDEHPTGCDTLLADYLKEHKIRYWNVVPNLVDHLPVKSRIDPRRSTKRQSFTFKY